MVVVRRYMSVAIPAENPRLRHPSAESVCDDPRFTDLLAADELGALVEASFSGRISADKLVNRGAATL